MRINYVIATWSGDRVKPVNREYYLDVLKNHLKILNTTENSIDQITIMKPINDIVNRYYDIELINKLKVVECENRFQSYGQYLESIKLFGDDFDYFIFIEDDYVPATDNFDTKLLKVYEEGTYLGAVLNVDRLEHPMCYCSNSNGMISRKAAESVLLNHDYNEWLLKYKENNPKWTWEGRNYQIAFCRYFLENGVELREFRKHFGIEYFSNGNIFDHTLPHLKNADKIFTPIQNVIK